MKIIDFARKGNVVRFYLGSDKCKDYHGDDWDDMSYEDNAGRVYDEYIKGYKDIKFDFEDIVLEPKDGQLTSMWCKNDFKKRRMPCIIVVPKKLYMKLDSEYEWQLNDFEYVNGLKGIKKYYFNDKMKGGKKYEL